jgi:hypothetical protein
MSQGLKQQVAQTCRVLALSGLLAVVAGCSSHQTDIPADLISIEGAVFTVPISPDVRGDLLDPTSELVDGGDCRAARGYDDISEGAQVTIRDSKGEIVAIGTLSSGVQTGSEGYTMRDWDSDLPICAFQFSVEAPSGLGYYSISVGNVNRGEVTFAEEELTEKVNLEIVN